MKEEDSTNCICLGKAEILSLSQYTEGPRRTDLYTFLQWFNFCLQLMTQRFHPLMRKAVTFPDPALHILSQL